MRSIIGLAVAAALTTAGCYLPKANIDRPLESLVLPAVYRCTVDFVSGNVRNDADVDVTVVLRALWLDADSEPFHDSVTEPILVPSGETVEWEALAGETVDAPIVGSIWRSGLPFHRKTFRRPRPAPRYHIEIADFVNLAQVWLHPGSPQGNASSRIQPEPSVLAKRNLVLMIVRDGTLSLISDQ